LHSRLRRHLRKENKTYWHIDYLLKSNKSKISKIWVIKKSVECEITNILLKSNIVDVVKKGFGSSDCKCITHFLRVKNNKKMNEILNNNKFILYSQS
jgi:Uri superfamily endonuclease